MKREKRKVVTNGCSNIIALILITTKLLTRASHGFIVKGLTYE